MLNRQSAPVVYGSAIALCGLAFTLAWLLDAVSSSFLLTVMAVCLYGGRRPAWFTLVLAACLFEFFFLPPRGHLIHSNAAFLRLGVFVGAMVLTIVMVEARKRSDEAKGRIGQDFRSLAETSPDSILFMGTDGVILFANPATKKMFGYDPDELLNQPATLILPELAERGSPTGEFLASTKDGATLYVESSCGRFGDKTTIFLRDISERKAAMKQMEQAEQSMRLTLETIPGFVFTRSASGRIEHINTRLADFAGQRDDDRLEDSWIEGLHPDEADHVLRTIEKNVSLGEPYIMEYRRRRHDGVYRRFQTNVQPLKDSSGHVIRWYGLVTDIEERYQAEESLRRTQSKLAHATQVATAAELAASIVHEISQPLSAMVANGQACLRWLATTPPSYDDSRAAVERIVRDGKDAAGIIKGLRSLFGRAPIVKMPVDVHRIVTEVVALLDGKAAQEGIAIEVDAPRNLPRVSGDQIQLQQVLMNLVTNGIESMQGWNASPKRLTIRVVEEGACVTTSVIDRGAGAEDYEAIFDAFRTTKQHGMGMGLAICRSIIAVHEGSLRGVAGDLGGSVFSFSIPHLGGHAA